jgi:hypothetical protein
LCLVFEVSKQSFLKICVSKKIFSVRIFQKNIKWKIARFAKNPLRSKNAKQSVATCSIPDVSSRGQSKTPRVQFAELRWKMPTMKKIDPWNTETLYTISLLLVQMILLLDMTWKRIFIG